MICLFLDTSSENLYVYLLKDNKIIYEKEIKSLKEHSTYLVPSVKEALDINNLKVSDIDKIFVGIGPGSFTGTRISITFAKTISYAYDIDLIPVSSLEEFIYAYDGYDYYVPVIEERKDKIYFSVFDKNKKRILDDSYGTKEELYDHLKKYEGNILIISDNENYEKYDVKKKELNVVNIVKNLNDEKSINPHILKPNYIKKIEVESKL